MFGEPVDGGVGELDAEGYSMLSEAMDDPSRVDVVITGRNGFKVTMGYPIGEHEDATIGVETKIFRDELQSGFGLGERPYVVPIPTGRKIVWTIETKSMRVPEGGF